MELPAAFITSSVWENLKTRVMERVRICKQKSKAKQWKTDFSVKC